MTEFQNRLKERALQIQVSLDEKQLSQFEQFYHLLIETNKVMNLTAITDWKEVIDKHFIDSISLIHCSDYWKGSEKVIDVGTGAGFPGIPLKIAYPELKITCMDSLNKRIEFLNRVIEACELKEIETVHGRAEDLGRNKEYREKYDLVVSRAVARMEVLAEYCIPFARTGGFFISYKSGQIEEELLHAEGALSKLKCHVEECKKFSLPETDMERSFVIVKKDKETPKVYPRKAGTPTKNPL